MRRSFFIGRGERTQTFASFARSSFAFGSPTRPSNVTINCHWQFMPIGRRLDYFSNQAKSPPEGGLFAWSGWKDSNLRPLGPKPSALSTAPHPGVGASCKLASRRPKQVFGLRLTSSSLRLLSDWKSRFALFFNLARPGYCSGLTGKKLVVVDILYVCWYNRVKWDNE